MLAAFLLALAAAASADAAPTAAAIANTAPTAAAIADELSRLEGQRVTISADGASYVIDDIAGEGKPLVGVVERRGDELWLITETDQAVRLTGVLAKPRIAGPGYKIWVLGRRTRAGDLQAHRLGVLAPPR